MEGCAPWHVAFLTAEYPPQPGGVGDYTRCLARSLTRAGHRVTVITSRPPAALFPPAPPSAPSDSDTEPFTVLRRAISSWGWRCWSETIAVLDRLRPDILHIQYQTGAYGMHPAVNLLPWRLRSLARRPRLAVTFHDLREPYLFPKAAPLRRWITRRLACDCDLVVSTNAEDTATLHHAGVAACHIPIGSNIGVAPPPGYEREKWREYLGVRPGETLVASFGLLSRSKGGDLLLEALNELDQESRQTRREHPASPPPNFFLLLIGGVATSPHDHAYADRFLATLQQFPWHERVLITGYVDEATVSAHLLATDCVVLPFRDGASFRSGSLLAALSHGAAVVTTEAPGGQGLEGGKTGAKLVDGEHALLVPPNDRRSLANALRRLARDPTLRERLSRGGQQAASPFTWDAIAHQHEREYHRLRQDGGSSGGTRNRAS